MDRTAKAAWIKKEQKKRDAWLASQMGKTAKAALEPVRQRTQYSCTTSVIAALSDACNEATASSDDPLDGVRTPRTSEKPGPCATASSVPTTAAAATCFISSSFGPVTSDAPETGGDRVDGTSGERD